MRLLLLGAAILVALTSSAHATDEVIESVGGWHVFKLAGSTDHILKLADFDFDGDGDLDVQVIHQIAYFGSASEDTLYYHSDAGWWSNPLAPSSEASIPLRTKRFSQIKSNPHPQLATAGVAVPDSTVFRYNVVGVATVYLYVWGS